MKDKMEILAPAGDEEMLRAAVFSGADCVYVGVQGFNARGGAKNFNQGALQRAAAFCRARNCGLYVALNILVLPGEEDACKEAIIAIAKAGCSGIIVQDLGVAAMVKKLVPALPLYASTQMAVHSLCGVQMLQKLGFAKAILARELEKKEILHIAQNTALPLEVFVHGALCVCVSGQCYFSAFLGGRSANRGNCAGTCRLPFRAAFAKGARGGKVAESHLSLKDLSLLEELPALQQMGIETVKIEGRLRGAEYTAAVVQAARLALAGKQYNKKLVRDIYSRSGFTKAWYTGEKGAAMFGVRSEEDAAAGRAAAPLARDIYRRELARVPVSFVLTLWQNSISLTLSDGENKLEKLLNLRAEKAENTGTQALQAALRKTGGYPFFAEKVTIETNGFFVPAAQINGIKTALMQQLLQKREAFTPLPINQGAALASKEIYKQVQKKEQKQRIVARLESIAQLPKQQGDLCSLFILPLKDFAKVPDAIKAKTYLHIPAINFKQSEEEALRLFKQAKNMGFAGFEAGNLAHFKIFEGERLFGGFGLNITNKFAAQAVFALGCESLTLSPELSLRQAEKITQSLPQNQRTALLAYGHLPLMVSRACPLQNAGSCVGCGKRGVLQDRKGASFNICCSGDVRTIYNQVPLWMADRNLAASADDVLLYFTSETDQEVAQVMQAFKTKKPCGTAFTRGLYEKGLQAGTDYLG